MSDPLFMCDDTQPYLTCMQSLVKENKLYSTMVAMETDAIVCYLFRLITTYHIVSRACSRRLNTELGSLLVVVIQIIVIIMDSTEAHMY